MIDFLLIMIGALLYVGAQDPDLLPFFLQWIGLFAFGLGVSRWKRK